MYTVLDALGLRHGDEQQRQRPVRRDQQSLRVTGSIAVAWVFAEPSQLQPELRQVVGISRVEGNALDAYGHRATSQRWRHLRLRLVSQPQEARKPTWTRVPHLLSLDLTPTDCQIRGCRVTSESRWMIRLRRTRPQARQRPAYFSSAPSRRPVACAQSYDAAVKCRALASRRASRPAGGHLVQRRA